MDRTAHTILLVTANGDRRALLASVEGPIGDDWPVSPPLQSVSIEERPDGQRVALLVGSAGSSHWSASVESAADRSQLIFDVACRHSTLPNRLSSRYGRSGTESERLKITSEQARIEWDDFAVSIEPTDKRPAGTTRWRYTITLADR